MKEEIHILIHLLSQIQKLLDKTGKILEKMAKEDDDNCSITKILPDIPKGGAV